MARRGSSGTMQVLLNGRLVGVLKLAGSGAVSLAYAPEWLTWEHSMLISLSLPLREEAHQGGPVIAYLEDLLPDNQAIRERVATRVRAGGKDAWHMLEKIGRDCVGASQFVSGDIPKVGALEGEPVTEAQIADMLRNLESAPLGLGEDDDFRISIAGAQEKTALLRHGGAWIRPSGLTPTTHILKTLFGVLPAGIDLSDSVENEFFCMSFCRAMGMEVAEVEYPLMGSNPPTSSRTCFSANNRVMGIPLQKMSRSRSGGSFSGGGNPCNMTLVSTAFSTIATISSGPPSIVTKY